MSSCLPIRFSTLNLQHHLRLPILLSRSRNTLNKSFLNLRSIKNSGGLLKRSTPSLDEQEIDNDQLNKEPYVVDDVI